MISYPLKTITIDKAIDRQFLLVEAIQRNFKGDEFLSNGDLGVVYGTYPEYTKRVEKTLADFFNSEDAVLIRGAGTGAIRNFLTLYAKACDKVLVHNAPIYSTTKDIISEIGLDTLAVDFNSDLLSQELLLLKEQDIKVAIVQHSRQKMSDKYDIEDVIQTIKKFNKNIKILVDDNYAVMKTENTGYGYGADASCFSLFKLLGCEGIGCVLCNSNDGDKIRSKAYSGGSKVQGFEAMECLRSLVYAPVSLAIATSQVDEIVNSINNGSVKGATCAVRANAQSVVAIVRFENPISKKAIEIANNLGCAPYPVGAESKYEIAAMFYRVSGTFCADDASLLDYAIRINPMRSSAKSVINILNKIVEICEGE